MDFLSLAACDLSMILLYRSLMSLFPIFGISLTAPGLPPSLQASEWKIVVSNFFQPVVHTLSVFMQTLSARSPNVYEVITIMILHEMKTCFLHLN